MAEENNKQPQQNKQTPKTETPKVEETKPVEEAPKTVVEPVTEEKPVETLEPVEEPVDATPKQAPTAAKTESINDIIDVKVYGDGFIPTINAYAPANERLTRDTVIDVLKEGFRVFEVTETKEEELAIEWTEKGPWLIIKK